MDTRTEVVSRPTQQVRLRTMEPGDAQALFCMENDPEVWQYTDQGDAPYTWAQIEQFVRTAPRDLAVQGQLRLVIELDGGGVVGTVDLYGYDPAQSLVWVGVLVWPVEFRGRGIGVAALRLLVGLSLGVDQFFARVERGNVASCRLFLRAGFSLIESQGGYLVFGYSNGV